MSGFRNRAIAAALAALAAGAAAAQDGSGIPRDPSQDFSTPKRSAPDRQPSLAVPLAPSGTLTNPSQPTGPASANDYLPAEIPSATQDGAFAEQGDGAVDPNLPSVLSGPSDVTPTETAVGETQVTPTRQQELEHQGYTITPPVETKPIDEVDPSATGTLTADQGSLGDDLWTDADYATVAGLLQDMPVATKSPAMNALIRRLLLTGAKTKEAPAKGPSLFDIRTQRLADAGLIIDLVALLDAQGGGAGDANARATAMLLNGRAAEACSAKKDDAASGAALQVRTVCQIAGGDAAAGALSADLARVKGVSDAAFFALVANLSDGTPLDPKAITNLTPATYALAQLAKVKLTAAALEGAAPGVLAAIARDDNEPAGLRIEAAQRAAAVGALDADTLATLLRTAKDSKIGALVQAAYASESLDARGKAIAAVLAAADAQGLGPLYADVVGPAAWDAVPAKSAAASADAVTRVLELSGRGDRAADWLNVADEATLGRAGLDELLVRVALGAPSGERVAAARDALTRMAEAAPYDEAKALRAVIYAGALDAMGFEIPPAAQGLLASSKVMAAPPVGQVETAEMADAGRSGRKGEAVLRALIALGAGGPTEAHPATVIEAVAALAAAGYHADASAIALEAALGRGVAGGG